MVDANKKQLEIGHTICYSNKMESEVIFAVVIRFTSQQVVLSTIYGVKRKKPHSLYIINSKYNEDLDSDIS